ncbi:helix-turn-helix domain-containing protein [Agromyces sp. SYSU T00194]|uniref:helix-turn-helix domain-containing protein n=1 Tax=Agromyces chitinivorans TaxID=3158560 RepID=UPI00339126B3
MSAAGVIRMEAWPALMTRETAAAYIDGSLRDVDELRGRGEITPVGTSKRVKFRKTDLDAWIERMPERT